MQTFIDAASQFWNLDDPSEADARGRLSEAQQMLIQCIREDLDLPSKDPEGTLMEAAEHLGIKLPTTGFRERLNTVCGELGIQLTPEVYQKYNKRKVKVERRKGKKEPKKVSGVQKVLLRRIREDLGLDKDLDAEETLRKAAEDIRITLPTKGFQSRLLRVCDELGIDMAKYLLSFA